MTEKELIRRCCKNDPYAQQLLYERYAPTMLGVCMRYVCDRPSAEDLMQEGFITVFTKIGTYRSEGSFEGWLRRIFVNTSLGYLRRNNVLDNAETVENTQLPTEKSTSAIELLSAEELLRCIGRLPDGYRMVLNLFAIEGYTHREIAEMLQISEGTSRSQYLRAKSALRQLLDKENRIHA